MKRTRPDLKENLLLVAFLLLSCHVVRSDDEAGGDVPAEEAQKPKNATHSTASLNGPDLPFGEFNVLILTDVHSWIAGHGAKEDNLNVDYGQVLSFYQRLKHHCLEHHIDLWFVMNGDWIDGTGLAMNGDPSYLLPLLEKMPWDATNVGNHELYHPDVVRYMSRPGGFIESFGDRYLSSNVLHADTSEPLGHRYRLLHGKTGSVLVFGFLYNMKDHCDVVTVEEIGHVVEEDWFKSALKDEAYDAIMVLAHMDVHDALVDVLLNNIRSIAGHDMPVEFVTGHTHFRHAATIDAASFSLEAGRYLDTVGFVSFPTKKTIQAAPSSNATKQLFHHKYIDGSVEALKAILKVDTLHTEDGAALSQFIDRTRTEMGLDDVVGCLENSFYIERGLHEDGSLWKFFSEEIVPSQFQDNDAVLFKKDLLRYDLLGDGEIRFDDVVAVDPFNETLFTWRGISAQSISTLNRTLNSDNESFLPMLPEYILASPKSFDLSAKYNLIVTHFSVAHIQEAMKEIDPDSMEVPAVPTNMSSTDLWLDYFRNQRPCKGGSGGHHSHGRPSNPFSFTPSSDTTDILRIAFAVAALVVVVVLAIVNVRQRHGLHTRTTQQRDFVIQEAVREYEQAYEYDADSYEEDEEEGEFV